MVVNVNWILIAITCAFIVMDLITGFAQACVNHCVDSQKMKTGLWHKCGFLLAIIFGYLCEITMQIVDLGFTIPVAYTVCVFIIMTEMVSNLENLGKISPELKEKSFMKIFNAEGRGEMADEK